MAIKRYRATADNTIANGYQENLATRATGSNMGLADVSEVYSIYGRESSTSSELSRILTQFDVTSISADRTAGTIPASGKVKFYLRLFNAETSKTVPKDFKLVVEAISRAWNEGDGLDLENYKDIGVSNWIDAEERTAATATIVASTPGSLLGGATFTLTNAAGTTTTYRINGGGSYDTQAGGTAGDTIDIFFGGASTVAHVAEAITKAVNATTNADMTASDDGTNVTIVQTTKGTTGNKTNSDASSGLTSVGNFTGAVGQWTTAGGDYHEEPTFEQTFETGLEDMELDITSLVEEWITGAGGGGKTNYGVGVRLTSSLETATDSYYTKRFFARGTQYFFKKPVIEARWNSSIQDDRGDFYFSSSIAPGPDNLNTIYLYNYVRGRLTNIPAVGATGSIMVSLYSGSSDNTVPSGSKLILYDGQVNITGGFVSTGIYSCSVAVTASDTLSISTLYDVWHSGSDLDEHATSTEYFTGSISAESFAAAASSNGNYRYVTNIKNLRNKYFSEEQARFNVYVRNKNWSPTIYTVASTEIENTIIPSASFRVYRVLDGLNVIPHGTGSDLQTILSYDVSGNYFNLDMSLLEPGYEYGIKLAFYDSQRQSWIEQDQKFLFRVEDYEY
jgi:hypothetical protein